MNNSPSRTARRNGRPLLTNEGPPSVATKQATKDLSAADHSFHLLNRPSMNKLFLCCLSFLIIFGFSNSAQSQCNPDITAPVVICDANLDIKLDAISFTATLHAAEVDDGSWDNCTVDTDLILKIEKGNASQNPPLTTSVTFSLKDIGPQVVTLWAIDESGNNNVCMTEINILEKCQGINPLPACPNQLEVQLETGESVSLTPDDILQGGMYCYTDFILSLDPPSASSYSITLTAADEGQHFVSVTDINTANACWCILDVFVDCQDDVIPPVAVCESFISLPLSMDGPDLTYLTALELNDGSWDNCTSTADLSFAIEASAMPSPSMPVETQIEFTAEGSYSPIILWVADKTGNTTVCMVDVEITAPSCLPDITSPACVAPGDLSFTGSAWSALGVDVGDFLQMNLLLGAATSYDYCGPSVIEQTVIVKLDSCDRPVEIIRAFQAADLSFNLSDTSIQKIEIIYGLELLVPVDPVIGAPQPDSLFFWLNGGLMSATYTDSLIDLTCNNATDLVIRTWFIDDPCKDNSDDPRIELPRLDLDNNGELGDAYLTLCTLDSMYLLENGLPTLALGPISGKYSYVQLITLNDTDTILLSASGQVFVDTLTNCTLDGGEPALAGWPVKAIGMFSGKVYTAITESDGSYSITGICPTDLLLELSLDVPFSYGQGCQTTWEVPCSQNDPGEQHIPVQLNSSCPIVEVELSAPFLRRCDANTYTVSYTNYSAEIIPDASIEVTLDSYLEFTGSSLQATALGNNKFAIELGDLEPGISGQVTLECNVSCGAPLGYTHCSEVYFLPDTLCPPSPEWSGANIEVSGYCDQDSIYLQIRNSGEGNMSGPLGYTIVEDVIMFMQDEFNLNASGTLDLPAIPSNGNPWHLEAEQEPDHPYPGNVAITVRGCEEQYNGGQKNAFPFENPSPFIANDCQANVSSFDPNAKSAFPGGYGSSHYIEQNTQIEYLLQFQNTGTDTAFQVVLLDTLSSLLDPMTIRTGPSSHKYKFELLQGHIMRFTFDPIILPQENVNEAGSHGYVKFTIDQHVDLAIGSIIENQAAIYFDKNDVIMTNTVSHTVGEDFIEVISDVITPQPGAGTLNVFPNPAQVDVQFQLDGTGYNDAQFLLLDAMGRTIRKDQFNGNVYILNRVGLEKGIYFYLIQGDGKALHSGKVILH